MIDLVNVLQAVSDKALELKGKVIDRRERATARKAYEQMASVCPGDFEALGYAFIRGDIKPSDYFKGDKAEYAGSKRAWEKKYNGRLPEYS